MKFNEENLVKINLLDLVYIGKERKYGKKERKHNFITSQFHWFQNITIKKTNGKKQDKRKICRTFH